MDSRVDKVVDHSMNAAVYMVGDCEADVDGVEVRHVADEASWNWDRNGNMATGNGNESELVLSFCFLLDSFNFSTFQELG